MNRLLLCLAAAIAAAPAFAADFAGTAGLQLYSLRDQFKNDVPGTLDRVKALGFTTVETAGTYGMSAAEFRKELDARGLKVASAHMPYERLGKEIDAVIAEAKTLGAGYVAVAWIPHEVGSFGEADVKRAAADFNQWGKKLKDAGLKFTYHCHGYEFRPVTEGASETLFDQLMKATDPDHVFFEMDVFWVVQPGADPAKLLEKYTGRWHLMHLKDIRKGARVGVFTGKAPLTDDVPLGTGMVKWPDVLRAASKSGVKHYFIEDESPTVLSQIPESLKYLESLK